MKTLQDIQKLLLRIETDYPELYTFLDEDPLTLQKSEGDTVSEKDLKEYLESLKQKLIHYREQNPQLS